MLYRRQNGMDAGIEQLIRGHKWYLWIDSGIEMAEVMEILTHMKALYTKAASPAAPSTGGGAYSSSASSH